MKVGDKELENVTEFEYLSSLLSWDNDCGKENRRRIAKLWAPWHGSRRYGQVKKSM